MKALGALLIAGGIFVLLAGMYNDAYNDSVTVAALGLLVILIGLGSMLAAKIGRWLKRSMPTPDR